MVESEEVTRHRGAARQIVKRAIIQALHEATLHRPQTKIDRLADHVMHRLEQRDLRDCLAVLTADG